MVYIMGWLVFLEYVDKLERLYNDPEEAEEITNKYPADLYTPSAKIYSGLPEVEYSLSILGLIKWHGRRVILWTKD